MPDILGGAYYGNETYVDTAPGGAWDTFIGYDDYAPADGYLKTVDTFDAPYEIVEWGGSSDPYSSPMLSTSDIIRSRDAGIPYPSNPINTVPPTIGSDTERSSFGGLFKGVVDVLGKSAVVLAGTLGAKALSSALGERDVPGRPASSATRSAGYQVIPPRPFVLPSFLGGGTFSPSSGNLIYIALAAVGVLVLLVLARR